MNVLTYEQLKQRLDAVVAECADLKTCAIGWAELYADEMGDPHITEDALPKTPNVTAALAEVEAKAIEKFAAFLDEPIDGKQCFEHAAGLARHFASTLREGRV
ncbi:hypothetical protein [Serratia fonticola]|uniref:hypothetical protein n=1 Tax=Serratia fonticola TaxID=47917 RepID=UPI00093EEA1E|nr:hypothetical protein [Serratia fonticola]OKP30175.1 hypothetical protein BSQ40_06790 [Serratia fonticola]